MVNNKQRILEALNDCDRCNEAKRLLLKIQRRINYQDDYEAELNELFELFDLQLDLY